MVRQDPAAATARSATTSRSTQSYPLFTDDIEQRTFDPDKAAFHYKKSGHAGSVLLRTSDVAFPGAVDAAQLYQQSAPRPASPSRSSASPATATGRKSGTSSPSRASYWGGRPTQDQMYSTAYLFEGRLERHALLQRPEFDKMLLAARAELDDDQAQGRSTATWR